MHPASARTFIFVTVFVDLIGYGIVIPLLPLFVQQQIRGGTVVGLLGALYACAQALGGPFLAGLSDRYGRRPILLICLAGTAGAYLLLANATNLWLIGLAILLDGFTGGNMSTAQAYIADSTPPDARAQRFGLVSAAYGLGMMAGPVIGGLLSHYGLFAPALAAAALAAANLLFGLIVLPESLPFERRSLTLHVRLNPLSQLYATMQRPVLRPLLLTVFLLNLAFSGLQSNFPIFSAERFGWNAQTNAFFYAFVGVCAVVTQALLLARLRPLFGEQRLATGGIALMAVGLGLVALVPVSWLLYPLVAILALGSNLSIPCLTALLSTRVGESEQGQLMGSLQSVLNLALIGGPLIAGFAFDTLGSGTPYLIGSVIALGALEMSRRVE